MGQSTSRSEAIFEAHDLALRDPAEIISQWDPTGQPADAEMFARRAGDEWWALLERLGITLLVTREYEHLVVALSAHNGIGRITFLRLPHPSGLAVNRGYSPTVRVAATRNPNQVVTLSPAHVPGESGTCEVRLMPTSSVFYPGRLYLHDLAVIDNMLVANAAGENCIVDLRSDGTYRRMWWPRALDLLGPAAFAHNYVQLNSIAAGPDLDHSYFTASTDTPGRRRPGHRNFAVNRRGVILDGHTRAPMARGLTRPHSARLYRGQLWVADSGYGRVGRIDSDGQFEPVVTLPGWTRGLCFVESEHPSTDAVLFAGTSRVLPRFAAYAPGVSSAVCALHAIDPTSGKVLASLTWPGGNQIFAIDWLPRGVAVGLPFDTGTTRQRSTRARRFFFDYQVHATGGTA